MTPMAMSLDYLRKMGYYAEPVEHRPYIPDGQGRQKFPITKDLFGFADIIALKTHVLLVQTTSRSNTSARMKKIQASEAFEWCKRAGMLIHVHGWGAGGVQVIDMSNALPNWSAILRQKKKGLFVTQADLNL